MSRDEKRFLECFKKSKSKIVHQRHHGYCMSYHFPDVVQTGWHSATIDELIKSGVISLEYVSDHAYRVIVE